MDPRPTRAPLAGGCFIALGAVAGALIGITQGQSSLGLVAGGGLGFAAALILALIELSRRR